MTLRRREFLLQLAGVSAVAVVGACAMPSARMQQSTAMRRIGYLNGGSAQTSEIDVFRQELRALGYIESRDFVIELRTAESVPDRLPALVAELLGLPADVIVPVGTLATLAAKQGTGTVPIVFHRVTDPVGQGIVASLARPGGNITGVSAAPSAGPKQLELLQETVPGLKRIAVLWNANNSGAALQLRDTDAAARSLRLSIDAFGVHNPDELEIALETIALSRPDALLVGPAFNLARHVRQIPDFAATLRLPAMYGTDAQMVRAGGLMAVGANTAALARRAAQLVDKVFRGARPADLPVEVPDQYDFVVNLSAADRIGLSVPANVLRQATEVVR